MASARSNPVGRATVLSRDIVDACLTSSWTSVSAAGSRERVEDELPEQRAVGAHDPDVVVGDEELHRLAGVGSTEPDVPEAAQVPDRDVAGLADPVLPDPVMAEAAVRDRAGLDPAVKGDERVRPARARWGRSAL